jgi:threonine dehydratase
MREYFRATHNVPEPTGSLAYAALAAEADRARDRRIALIQSGGNVDSATFATVLAGRTPAPPSVANQALTGPSQLR